MVLARWCERLGLRIGALCDHDPDLLTAAAREFPGAARLTKWEEMLDRGLDGVVLANDFDQHAALAIAFLDRGVHVLSETAACVDEAEGQALIAADKRSTATYSFAENYVAHPHVRLIKQIVAADEIGAVELIECDYLHGLAPADVAALTGDPRHWRGRISPTAYCTHTVSPVLDVTQAWPTEVTALPVQSEDRPMATVLAFRLSSGALALTRQTFLQGEPDSHSSWLSVRGTRGLAESLRMPGEAAWSVRWRSEPWANDGHLRDETIVPPPLTLTGDSTVPRGQEGSALIVAAFRDTVTASVPPRVPVRPAVAASLVGVYGARSLAEGSRPVALPDVSAW
ncbi:Gfo/Idh/MocA family protein [Cryptosporangium minutisporangium]